MRPLTPEAQQVINNLAQRYGLSVDAVTTLLQAVVQGQGTMAQFNHPELGGGGQWMQGGMTMVGDMFNYNLKNMVDGLCNELAQLIATSQPFQTAPMNDPFQNSGYSGNWWPSDLGQPNSSGGQNNVRYAYFSYPRRLAIEINGQVTIYDTQNHQIGGVSQQQGGNQSLTFTSQYGLVNLSDLPIVSSPNIPQFTPAPTETVTEPISYQTEPAPYQSPPVQTETPPAPPVSQSADILTTIERLAELKEKGIITEKEYRTKKAELLARL